MAITDTTPTDDSPPYEGPRERLIERGPGAPSDAELIAILLGTGTRERPVLVLATDLLTHVGGLRMLARASVMELATFPGLGPSKAACLVAACELGRRVSARPLRKDQPMHKSADVIAALGPELVHLHEERFVVLTLDAKNRPIARHVVGIGSNTACPVSPSSVFRLALCDSAVSVILVHNHPSGHPRPSEDDIHLTARLRIAGDLLGIRVLDHVVVGTEGYFSFLDQGMMKDV